VFLVNQSRFTVPRMPVVKRAFVASVASYSVGQPYEVHYNRNYHSQCGPFMECPWMCGGVGSVR